MRNIIIAIIIGFFLASCGEQAVDNPPPESFELSQNFPNPFTDTTVIDYGVPNFSSQSGPRVRVAIYDRFNELVELLVEKNNHSAGKFRINWRPFNKNPSGLYYIELQVGNSEETFKRIAAIKK
ncbi:MAG: hypothetical protein Q8L88_14830 [Bacteroidota bacterium]|nr:hypothetical protein [Bacteroidota bacterium]